VGVPLAVLLVEYEAHPMVVEGSVAGGKLVVLVSQTITAFSFFIAKKYRENWQSSTSSPHVQKGPYLSSPQPFERHTPHKKKIKHVAGEEDYKQFPDAWRTPPRRRSPDTGAPEHPATHRAEEHPNEAAEFPHPVLRDAFEAEPVQQGT